MTNPAKRQYPLALELGWFIRLRWIAGFGVGVSGALEYLLTPHPYARQVLVLGIVILLYNAALLWSLKSPRQLNRTYLLRLAAAQMLLDLVCLSLLTCWTSGLHSPILGFFVFHMVFASVLLPWRLAYGTALAPIGLLAESLLWTGQFPQTRDKDFFLACFIFTLLMTVAFPG
jgi:hypothetical protein